MSENQIEKVTKKYKQDPVTRKIERVAAYVRVSTQEQKLHGLSLDAQRAKLAEYAEQHGMEIVDWYVDDGVSGRKLIRNRPELQRMIQDAEQGKIERIIFIKLDRFFRSVAEYHECMKRISPVVWTTTEEEYDLTTANGRMLVNMKLTIAEMEADMAGERIDIVNQYKLSTGQPLTGSMPFGFKIAIDETTGRKKIIKDPDEAEIIEDLLNHFLTFQSKHKTVFYINAKYQAGISYRTVTHLLSNTFLCGEYRGNTAYCEPYIDRTTFDKIQTILSRNIKHSAERRTYIFTGLIRCPGCGRVLNGASYVNRNKNGTLYQYKKYRCSQNRADGKCSFNKVISEPVFERMMLSNIEQYFGDAKIRVQSITDAEAVKVPVYNIDEINAEIDRLNYSWQTGKIRTVEKYEKDYAALMEKLDLAVAEQSNVTVKDFSKIEEILSKGWKEIYNALDEEHKRAFWRSFISSIEIHWTTDKKEITRVNFF